jgi:hypothetical protein
MHAYWQKEKTTNTDSDARHVDAAPAGVPACRVDRVANILSKYKGD